MNDKAAHAPVIAPPPILLAVSIAAAFTAQHFWPLPLFSEDQVSRKYLAIALFAVAVAIFAAAVSQFIKNKTDLSPYKPTSAIVVGGIYRFTRNPIYIAFLCVALGFAASSNSAWFLFAALILLLLLHFGVVKREEHYLSSKFGGSYDDYRRRVRRWI